MRRILALAVLAASLAGCSTFKRTFGIKDTAPAHREPRTTSIYGDWVLANPDSTAFAGARTVQLHLDQSSFAISANYPSENPISVRGSAATMEGGLLTLTPTTGLTATSDRWTSLHFTLNRPITVLASAAGNTLVFSPPQRNDATPSSVWYRLNAAQAAGKVPATTTQTSTGEVTRPPR
jgi:hypothetical protein